MNFERILFPTDFSHDNDAALAYASTLAAESHATLYIVHVDEVPDVGTAMGEPSYLYAYESGIDDRGAVRKQLSEVVPTVAEANYVHHFLSGSPVTELLRFAEREEIDLIVMASHGRTGIKRLLMGSIAEGVMREAECPVLIVKPSAAVQASVESVGFTTAQLHNDNASRS